MFSTKQQELLLQAALFARPGALAAWEEWKANTDFDGYLDKGSFRLLPLLYKNLRRHGADDSFMHKLKGIYRLTWYENQLKFHDVREVLHIFHEAGIQTMLLKGTALALLHYKDNGVRPMADIDILVPTGKARSAIELLTKSGWIPKTESLEADLRYRHALSFTNRFGREFDLHWHVLHECCQERADDDFWEKPVSIKIGDVSTFALNPTDTLLHIIIHGVRWNPVPNIRWIADAITIINCSEIDWARLSNQAEKRRLGLRLREGLGYLQGKFRPCLQNGGVKNVNGIRTTWVERIECRYALTSQEKRLLGDLPLSLIDYVRFKNGAKLFRTITGLPEYLQYRFRARDKRNLLFLLLRKSLRRTMQAIKSRTAEENSR